jgi:hypothetical protein
VPTKVGELQGFSQLATCPRTWDGIASNNAAARISILTVCYKLGLMIEKNLLVEMPYILACKGK